MTKANKFEAESIFHLKPRREIQRWLDGAAMECLRCNQFVEEGQDCSNKHYLLLQPYLDKLMEQT